jgi:hypothetical protein
VYKRQTWNRKLIKHVVIDPALIKTVKFEKGAWPSVKP